MAKSRARLRSAAAAKGWITRRARAEGKEPARVFAALKGWDTRRRAQEHAARIHGQKAREATERRLTPAQKAARTRDAARIAQGPTPAARAPRPRQGRQERQEPAEPREPIGRRGGRESLDDYYDSYDETDFEEFDVETSPDYEDTPS